MLYTRKGDTGESGLFGTKERFPKDSLVYEALGTIDELNSLLGVCRAKAAQKNPDLLSPILSAVQSVQERLFIIEAQLAGAEKTITQKHVEELERVLARLEEHLPRFHNFVIPGVTELSSFLDLARAVSRRAERTVITLSKSRPVSDATKAYLNRLSSLLYALARFAATQAGAMEVAPSY